MHPKRRPRDATRKGRASRQKEANGAKLVKRTVLVTKNGKATGATRQVPVKPEEVLDFKGHGDRVVVVTTDGRKLEGKK